MQQNSIEYWATLEDYFNDGMDKGRAEGRSEGRAEGIELVARKMKSAGKDIAEITEMTGLSSKVIAAL